MKEKIICPICGKKYIGEQYGECPVCGWGFVGYEEILDPDEKEAFNLMSINQAKQRFAEGKDIWGEPLKK